MVKTASESKNLPVVKILASFNLNKKCIFIDGEGAATIKFDTDATQLANVLRAFAEMKNSLIELTLKRLPKSTQNGKTIRTAKTYR